MQMNGGDGRSANYLHPLSSENAEALERRWAAFRAAAPQAGPESVPVMFGRTIEMEAFRVGFAETHADFKCSIRDKMRHLNQSHTLPYDA